MLFKQIIFLLLALNFVRSSFNLLTNIEHFKKDFLSLLRLRSQQHDVIVFHNVPQDLPLVHRPPNRPTFQQTQFAVVPTVQPPLVPPPRPQSPPPPPPPPPSPSTSPPLPVIPIDVDEKPVIFPDYGDFNEVLFREQTLTKNFHNKKTKI